MSKPYNQQTAIHALMRGETLPDDWMAELAKATKIDLSYTNFTDLTPLAGLTGLQTLWLNDFTGTDLTPLAGLTARIYK